MDVLLRSSVCISCFRHETEFWTEWSECRVRGDGACRWDSAREEVGMY